jgi:UDP-GlcNAc:undecaprenyl-phosphate GlcNAc-1-phosphate transferase
MWATLSDHLEVLYGAAAAFAIVIALTPAVGGFARRVGAVDVPGADPRRVHRLPVPRLGGLALFIAIFVPALAFLDLTRPMRGLLIGAAVATTVGAIDDFRGLSWWQKLGGQLAAAVIPVAFFSVWIDRFTFPVLGIHSLPMSVGAPLTVLWIVGIMNMVNFLDGLDGLAAGVCAIAGFTFAVIALSLSRPNPAVYSAIVFGACLGFLRHNFYPARIFMGDSGAMLLGFLLAGISVQGLLKTAATVALFFPLLVLAVPILDTSFVLAKRLKYRQPLYLGDRTHLHHRFLNIGFSQRRAVVYLDAWCAALATAALGTRFLEPHAHGVWHLWRTVAAAAIALLAVGASIYIAYLLEIVKLANPRVRRQREAAEQRRSA